MIRIITPMGVERKTHLRAYCHYPDRFLKRTLAPSEYALLKSGNIFLPYKAVEMLQNEAACLRYIREKTDIPVPKVLDAYEKDGIFFLYTEFIQGVTMEHLEEAEREKVIPQVLEYAQQLHTLRSKISGGPSGIICPRYTQIESSPHLDPARNIVFQSISSEEDTFVFCHGDLAQANIIVDPETLKVNAIIDWETGGYYPPYCEIPFFLQNTRSYDQATGDYRDVSTKIGNFFLNDSSDYKERSARGEFKQSPDSTTSPKEPAQAQRQELPDSTTNLDTPTQPQLQESPDSTTKLIAHRPQQQEAGDIQTQSH